MQIFYCCSNLSYFCSHAQTNHIERTHPSQATPSPSTALTPLPKGEASLRLCSLGGPRTNGTIFLHLTYRNEQKLGRGGACSSRFLSNVTVVCTGGPRPSPTGAFCFHNIIKLVQTVCLSVPNAPHKLYGHCKNNVVRS